MKKVLFAFIIILTLLLTPVIVLAEEPETEEIDPPVEEVEPVEEEPQEQAEPTTNVDDAEPTLDEFKAEVETWMANYMEESMVSKIITWLVDAGVLTALFGVYLKYRKYKNTTVEDMINQFKDKMGNWLKENFDKLSVEQIDKIKDAINCLEKSNETIMKVLVLMQDNTPKGKAALIEYLGSKTNNEEVKDAATKVNKVLEAQEKADAEVKNKVAGEYEEIF